jgi:membrane protease YdiL (CAAX protease family)
MAYRFAGALPVAMLFGIFYLHRRRLLPMIVAHWDINVVGVVVASLLPLFAR